MLPYGKYLLTFIFTKVHLFTYEKSNNIKYALKLVIRNYDYYR